MYIASLTGAEIASRLPVIRADAIAPASPLRLARMRPSMPLRMPSMKVAYLSQAPGGLGGSALRIAPRKAGGTDPLEVQVAGEVVAAGAQRRERRIEPGGERNEAADARRGSLAHRKAHALERLLEPAALDPVHLDHHAVGPLALLPDLDPAGERHVPRRLVQHRMGNPGALERRAGK